jgi:UDP-4-amino-4,6-dideoxy-N-acetyl-beta-L-altrosamine transaminase
VIPYGRQSISESDIAEVVKVLRSDWLTQGPAVPNFEVALASYCGVEHGVAMNSATSALHVACLALGIRPGDRVWTSPNTFVASANCARLCGAEVDFVDIDRRNFNMDVDQLEQKLARAASNNVLPKAIIPVHFGGLSCEMVTIGALAARYGCHVVEDASHAVGGDYRGEKVGNCRQSDISVFSFHPVKVITTAEGGMAMTNQKKLADRMARLRTHGVTRDAALMAGPVHGSWYYEQLDLGLNYRMTDLQAALGLSQLSRLDAWLARRRLLARRYDNLLAGLPLEVQAQTPDAHSAFHLYVIRLHDSKRRAAVFQAMRAAGIGVNVHYIPVHLQPYYRELGFKPGDFPNAEAYYDAALTLPLHPGLSDAEQDHVVQALWRCFE